MSIDYRAFDESMIPDAGALFASRHTANRTILSLLPQRFEEPGAGREAVLELWHSKARHGFAAFRGRRLIAYLIGDVTIQPWGRCGYVYLPGYAVAQDEDPEVLKDLYARLGDSWLHRGAFNHYIYVSAADRRAIDSFFDVGFGKERVDALLDLSSLNFAEASPPNDVTIRRAGPGDNHHLAGLSHIIYGALSAAPYWHPVMPEHWDELREGWAELADDGEWTIWLALQNGEAIGMVGFHPEREEPTQILASPHTVSLSIAATKPEARGRGIGTCLNWRGLRQARQDGFRLCHADWISSNLLAARHFPRCGFRDVSYRLSRRISLDVAWTRT